MTTATRPDPPALTPLELDALAGWLEAHACFGDGALAAAVAEVQAVVAEGQAVRAQLLQGARVTAAREELTAVTARFVAERATSADVARATAEVRRAEAAERDAADRLVEFEQRRQAACARLCARVGDAVRPHAEASRRRLAGAVKKALASAETAAQDMEELAAVVHEVGGTFDHVETSWLPGLGHAARKLQLPQSGVRLAESAIRFDLRAAHLASVGGGGRHRSWLAEVQPILRQLEKGR